MKTIYRIETIDGHVVRKKATRPYVVGVIKRVNNKPLAYHSFSINFNKKINEEDYNKGFRIEPLKAIEI